MAFNLDNYETVEVRLEKFIKDFPDFRIDTELESFANDRFIVKAYIYRTFADSVSFATGYAEEKITDRGVNATSALENCETSAHLQTLVTQLKAKDQAAKKWEKSLE
jgi:predicted metalloprotease with PDZ domain